VADPLTTALTWVDLMSLFINHMSHAYGMTLPDESSIVCKGKLEPIDLQIGRRKANKKVSYRQHWYDNLVLGGWLWEAVYISWVK
jgi:hypothetical protein